MGYTSRRFLFCALAIEARVFIDRFGLKKISNRPEVYVSSRYVLAITGVGSLAVSNTLGYIVGKFENEIDKNSVFVNIGTASSASMPIGSLFLINACSKEGEKKSFYPDIFTKTDIALSSLLSLDLPINAKESAKDGVLYDMEGYGFCSAANSYLQTHQYQLIKIVSDNLSDNLFSKEFIYGLFTERLSFIENFLDSLKLDLHILDRFESAEIDGFCERLNFSFTQKEEIKELFFYYKLGNKSVTKFLEKYDKICSKNKTNRNKIFKDVRQSLVTA